jgi:ribosomal protein S18 acetylase RimI-like enzyme
MLFFIDKIEDKKSLGEFLAQSLDNIPFVNNLRQNPALCCLIHTNQTEFNTEDINYILCWYNSHATTKIQLIFVSKIPDKAQISESLDKITSVHKDEILFCAIPTKELEILKQYYKYEWFGHPYNSWLYNFNISAVNTIETQWKDSQNTIYTLSALTTDDIDTILSKQTVTYSRSYIEKLFTLEPFKSLNCGVRVNNRLVSWCLTHQDLSIGLIATLDEFRTKGLAKICVMATLESHRDYFKANYAYSHVALTNEISQKLLRSVGFKMIEGVEYFWAQMKYE